MMSKSKPLRITALILDDMSTTAISGPVEMLMIATSLAGLPSPEVLYVSPTGKSVQAMGGLTLACTHSWWEIEHTDILLLGACSSPERESFLIPNEMKPWLKGLAEKCTFIFSLCTGAFLLAELGMLNNCGATTHWFYAELFRHRYPRVRLMPHLKVTHEQGMICTSGVKEYFGATIMLIDLLFGGALRKKCEQFFCEDSSTFQQVYLINFRQFRQHNDSLIHALQDWIHTEDPSKISVMLCAEKVYLSERQMKRRFKAATGETPLNYIQRLRLAIAREKLDTTSLNIDKICYQVGYTDVDHFRLLFKKFYHMTPTEYRRFTQVDS